MRVHLRHPYWKTFNDYIGVKGLENISRQQRVVDPSIFVGMQARQLLLPYVDHCPVSGQAKRNTIF